MLKNIEASFENQEIEQFIKNHIPLFYKYLNKFDAYLNKNNENLSIYFVSEETMKKLNKQYRGIDKVTDVLSFRLEENINEEAFVDKNLLKHGIRRYLGEIILCPEYLAKKGREYGEEDINEFFIYMVLHSYLHLSGWEHDTEEKYIEFEKNTESLLKILCRR